MTKFLLLLTVFPFVTCNGQNTRYANAFVNNADLKGKIWHVGKSRVLNNRGGIIFSDDVYLHFLDKDSIQMKFCGNSPSVGLRSITMNGTYQVDGVNEVSLTFADPRDAFGRNLVSIEGKEVQFSLYALSTVRNTEEPASGITTLPQIKRYHFRISKYLTDNDFIAELTLLDDKQAVHPFGTYRFDNNKTAK